MRLILINYMEVESHFWSVIFFSQRIYIYMYVVRLHVLQLTVEDQMLCKGIINIRFELTEKLLNVILFPVFFQHLPPQQFWSWPFTVKKSANSQFGQIYHLRLKFKHMTIINYHSKQSMECESFLDSSHFGQKQRIIPLYFVVNALTQWVNTNLLNFCHIGDLSILNTLEYGVFLHHQRLLLLLFVVNAT